MADQNARPLTALVWILVVAVLLIGGYKLFHMHNYSADQRVLIDHSNR